MNIDDFIARWTASGGSERANFQQFAIELTQLLGVPAPKPATADAQNDDYRFERPVTFIHTGTKSRGFIDLYRRASFIMEAKQGTGAAVNDENQLTLLQDMPAVQRLGHGVRGSRRWDDTMLRARNQADGYARAVAREDGWPPFLLIVDVGHVIEVYSDFSGQGQGYTQFPDGNRYRITLDDLRDDTTLDSLRAIWTDPHSLDPTRVSALVTRQVAGHLAELGKSFETQGHSPDAVARFLMRALFTMFAEDVQLIPENALTKLLKDRRGQPVLRDFRNIENRDAVLAYDGTRPRLDAAGQPVTRWDGISMIRHPVTGDLVPDAGARVEVLDYLKPRPAKWPQADFIVGNPPFIGASRMRDALGDGYTEALRSAYPRMPESADFVMFWWEKAALETRAGKTRRLGFITTNSLRQTLNRQVLEQHLSAPKKPLSLVFAIPDHPWVDAGDGAAVRIAMTVAAPGAVPGRLLTVTDERKGEREAEGRPVTLSGEVGKIHANLRIGADVAGAKPLRANAGISSPGVKLHGAGFIVTPAEARALGLGTVPGLEAHIRTYRNGRDLTASPRGVMVIDLFGLSEAEVRNRFPAVYQCLADRVRPERDAKAATSPDSAQYARLWWLHGKPRPQLRPALEGLPRYIATVETAKHRFFQFLDAVILPDNMLIAIALDDAAALAVLSSRIHVLWALKAGGTLEDRPRYNKSLCFDPFPFPDATEVQKTRLRALGEELDAHRKAQQAAHPKLTLTGIYNVLEKLRAGVRIEGKDKEIYDQGLVRILKDIHDRIDAEVAAAYGWADDPDDETILMRLVDLNRERFAEEAAGHIRWLRPEYQKPAGHAAVAKGQQTELDMAVAETTDKALWPKHLPEQIAAVRAVLSEMGDATPEQVARRFKRGRAASVQPLLESLTALGQARLIEGGRFAA